MTQASKFPWKSVLTCLILILSASIVIPITDTEVVLDSSFSVDPGFTYGPYDEGTVFHPKILGSSVLEGLVIVEGGAILFTVNGHYTNEMKDLLILGVFEFEIGNAHEQYTFFFNNTGGGARVSIRLRVEEVWTRPLVFTSPMSTLFAIAGGIIVLAGIAIVSIDRMKLQASTSTVTLG